MRPHQRVGVEAVQELHHVVERAVGGHAEVEQLYRVRRAEPRDGLRLLLEAALLLLRRGAAADRPADELDGRGARQHPMPGAPDLAHPALAQPLLQPIAPHLARRRHLSAETVDDARPDVGEPDAEGGAEHGLEVCVQARR